MNEDALNEDVNGEERISSIGQVGDAQWGFGAPPDQDSGVAHTTAGSSLSPTTTDPGLPRPGLSSEQRRRPVARVREDWADPSLSDWHGRELYELTPGERKVVQDAWTARALQSHHRLGKLSCLTTWLLSWSAPWELIVRAQRAALEAMRSTEELFGVATALAGRQLGPGPFAAELAVPPLDESLIGLLVEEATAHHAAASAARVGGCDALDEEIADLLQRVARLEDRAGDLYLRAVEWVLGVQPATRRYLFTRLENHAFYSEAASSWEAARPDKDTATDELLRSYGITPDESHYATAFQKTVEPRLMELLSPPSAAPLGWQVGA